MTEVFNLPLFKGIKKGELYKMIVEVKFMDGQGNEIIEPKKILTCKVCKTTSDKTKFYMGRNYCKTCYADKQKKYYDSVSKNTYKEKYIPTGKPRGRPKKNNNIEIAENN